MVYVNAHIFPNWTNKTCDEVTMLHKSVGIKIKAESGDVLIIFQTYYTHILQYEGMFWTFKLQQCFSHLQKHKDKRFSQSELHLLGFILSKIIDSNDQSQSHSPAVVSPVFCEHCANKPLYMILAKNRIVAQLTAQGTFSTCYPVRGYTFVFLITLHIDINRLLSFRPPTGYGR